MSARPRFRLDAAADTIRPTSISAAPLAARYRTEIHGRGRRGFVDGLYMLNGSQHTDTHSVIDHQVPNCTSHQKYKGVLNDKSRAVFNGKVFVRENAHGTDASSRTRICCSRTTPASIQSRSSRYLTTT